MFATLEDIGLLRTIEGAAKVRSINRGPHKKPVLLPSTIRGISHWQGDEEAICIWTTTDSLQVYELPELAPSEIEAIQEFIKGRLQDTPQQSIAGTRNRLELVNKRVIVQTAALAPRCTGKLWGHAKEYHYDDLGDSWLVGFDNGAKHYIPANIIYLDDSPTPTRHLSVVR
jgi:methylase of polypeptide subunit release factors